MLNYLANVNVSRNQYSRRLYSEINSTFAQLTEIATDWMSEYVDCGDQMVTFRGSQSAISVAETSLSPQDPI